MALFGSGRSDGPSHPSNQDLEHKNNAVLNQMLDLFLGSVELDVIQSVLEICKYDYDKTRVALQCMSQKDVPDETPVLPTMQSTSLPQQSHPEYQRIQHVSRKPALPKTQQAVVSTKNRPRQSPSQLVLSPTPSVNQVDQTLHRIHKFINDGNKILVLMRGCPGSGKSYLAEQLLQWCGGKRSNHVFSSDDYFLRNGKYVFNPQEIQCAHKLTQDNVLKAVRNGYSPVVVDNTNTQSWEMQIYVIMAVNHGYAVETLEPQTPWRFNHAQLVKRNSHNVPSNTIRAMLERYEHGVTGEDIIKQLKLNYPPSKHPPQPARETPNRNSQCASTSTNIIRSPEFFSSHSPNKNLNVEQAIPLFKRMTFSQQMPINANEDDRDTTTLAARSSQSESSELRSETLKVNSARPSTSSAVNSVPSVTQVSLPMEAAVVSPLENPTPLTTSSDLESVLNQQTIPEINNAVANPQDSDSKGVVTEEEEIILIDLETNIPDEKTGEAESTVDVVKSESIESDFKDRESQWEDADWEGFVKEASEKESDNDCSTDQRQRWLSSNNCDMKTKEKEEISACSSEPRDYLPKTNDWGLSEAFCSWDLDVGEEKNCPKDKLIQRRFFAVSKQHSGSNTNYQDFLFLSNYTPATQIPPGVRVVTATSRNINEHLVYYFPPIPMKMVVDKSSMTDNYIGSAVTGSLNELLRMFPNVSPGNLETLLETCHGDVNWASNCLLDTESGVRLDIPSISESENPSPEPRLEPPVANAPQPGSVELNSDDVSQTQSSSVANQPSPLIKSPSQTLLDLDFEENVSLRRSSSLPSVASQATPTPTPPQTPQETAAFAEASCQNFCVGLQERPPDDTVSECVSSEKPKRKSSIYPALFDENDIKLLEASDESETSSQDDDEMLEFVISPEFSQQLFCRFGGPQNKLRKSGISPLLRIPESIACQIHYYLVLSQQEYSAGHEEEEEEEEEESLVNEQDKMGQQLFEQMCAEKPLTKQEQEDMELATAIYELDLAAVYNTKETMAAVLARRLLKDTFPTLDPNLLDELMEVQGYSFHKTKRMIQEHYMNSYTVKQDDFPTISASQTKTPSRSRSEKSDRVRLRTQAEGELHIARIYEQKAKEQSAKREWSAAAVYTQMAKVHQRQYSRNMELRVQRVLANNMKFYCPSSLDLHCLVVDEALLRLDAFLDDHIHQLADTPNTVKSLYIITGRGKHSSGGVPKIRPAVLERLDQRYLDKFAFTLDLPKMVDYKYEPRSYATRFLDIDQQNRCESAQIPPPMPGYYSSYEDANVGGCGDRLLDLECQLATSLSKELLSALDAPTQRPLPDYERNKVTCLKNAILELKKENDALHRELRKAECSLNNINDGKREAEPPRPQSAREPALDETPTRRSERDVACQTTNLSRHDRTSKSRRSVAGSIDADLGKSHLQDSSSSHSKCIDWLSRKKPVHDKRDDLDLVRLALWQLWELADRALTQSGQSNEGFPVSCPENASEEHGDNEKEHSRTDFRPNEIDQLRSQLARLLRSKDRMKRRRDEQAILLKQKETQVSRLQRSRHHLMNSFKRQFLMLRQQQALELKALQLEMQTERASSFADQTSELEDRLQGAVQQLEERYRLLLRDAYNERSKDLKRNSQGQRSKEESGT